MPFHGKPVQRRSPKIGQAVASVPIRESASLDTRTITEVDTPPEIPKSAPGGSAVQGTHGHVHQGEHHREPAKQDATAHFACRIRFGWTARYRTSRPPPGRTPGLSAPKKESGQSKSVRCPRKLRERPDYHCPLALDRPQTVCVNRTAGIVALSPIHDPPFRLPQPAYRRIATPGAFRPSRGGLVASAAARGSRARDLPKLKGRKRRD
jgi:hypothetical protein